MENQYQQQEFDEIDLMDYVLVLIKRKWTIFGITLITIFIVALYSFSLPSVYETDAILEIGEVESSLIEQLDQLKQKVQGDVYGLKIRQDLDISKKEYPKIEAERLEGSNLLSLAIESTNTEIAKNVLESITGLILQDHEQRFSERIQGIESEIQSFQAELDFLKAQKVYADQGIASLQIRISQKRDALNNSKPTEIVRSPVISEYPIGPNKKLNVVIAGILGLFVGIFVAFSKEWWLKNKSKV